MAYDYNKSKQMYQSMTKEQQQQFVNQNKNDANFKQFMSDYMNDINGKNQTNTQSNFNNWQKNLPEMPTEMAVPSWEEQKPLNQETPTVQKTENQNYNFDPNETLDESMFKESDGKIRVQEWTAKETWMPDYTLDSDARTKEITDNLNAYWQTNREYFSDRNTYNNMFHYNERSDTQKAVLDSYWKKKEDMDNASKYNTWDAISNWMNNAEITTDQLNYIKEMSPEAYREWQQKQLDDINLRIANMATPADPTTNAELFNSLLEKLNLDPWDPYQIYDNWYGMCERLGVFSDSEKLRSYQNQLDVNHSKMESIMGRYSASTGWAVSDALAAARMNKALAPYQQREVDLQNSYTTLLNGRNSNLAIANQSANVLVQQAAEDQRVWNQRLQWLNFSMQTAQFRTPEQQAQLRLQEQQISNNMSLLQTSQTNDLNLYNKYATSKLENQLQSELTDLSVKDPTQLRANLNNVLSDYYKNYWDIIQRPQSQVIDDVLAYAEEHGVSVAEALRENFIKPLQNKKEYKNMIATNYAAPNSTTNVWYTKMTINWKDYLIQWNSIIDPASMWIGVGNSDAKPYNIVSPEVMEAWVDYIMANTQQGQSYGQCGKFVNDYLVSIWATASNNRYFGNEDVWTRENRCNQQFATKWAIAVFNYDLKSSDWINHWHVAVVTKTYDDWSFDVVESNYPSWQTVNKRHVSANDAHCLWFINPSLWASSTQWYNAQDPYSWVSGYTSTGKEINAGWWITSLESSFNRWEKLTDTQRKSIETSYWISTDQFNEQMWRYMDYVETKQMVDSILDVKARAMKLKEWAMDSENDNLKWSMDLSIAEKWYANWIQNVFTTDDTIERIQKGKALYDNLMSNAGFQKYLDMKNNWAQFWIMTDSEWNKVDSSVAPLKWEQKDDLFLENLNDMINWYDEVLKALWYDVSSTPTPQKNNQTPDMSSMQNSSTWSQAWNVTHQSWLLSKYVNGHREFSYDWWLTWIVVD